MYPKQDELVYVRVEKVEELAAGVQLLEYGNIEGMVQLSELTRRRIRSMNRLIRVGKFEVLVVLRVDPEKGYIDLSKRRVSTEDVKKCEEKYNKSKSVHSILRQVAKSENVKLEDLYSGFAWPLYRKFNHAYDALEMIAKQERDRVSELAAKPSLSPEQLNEALSARWATEMNVDPKLKEAYMKDLLSNLSFVNQLLSSMSSPVKAAILQNIKNRLTPQITKIRCDLEVSCFKYEGIEAIKAALRGIFQSPNSNALMMTNI
jgi:translation initiation factor 2 subunit 1